MYYNDLVQGESLWGLACLHSFRAPAGTLDKRRDVLTATRKSVMITPEFVQRYTAVRQQLAAKYQANLRADYAEINAARQRSAQLTAQENQFLANVDRSLVAQRAPAGGSGAAAGRTANDRYDDWLRGVETTDDPSTGTSQHSFLEKYHWTDGYGNYRNSNDQDYDPNKNEVGNWQMMTPAQ